MSFFKDRQPSTETKLAMVKAAEDRTPEEVRDRIGRCKKSLSTTTNHKFVELTENGSTSIFLALAAIGAPVMVPDQGIWRGTLKHATTLDIRTSILPTNLGVINTETLEKSIEEIKPAAFLLTSFAGYIAEQEVKHISRICRRHDVILVEDASSSIGDGGLADGTRTDVIVGSARVPKLLNLPSGGFITSNDEEIMSRIKELNKHTPDPVTCAGILEELKHSQNTLDKLTGLSAQLKEALEPDVVVHQKKRGVCVGLLHKNPKSLAKKARQSGLVTESGRSLLTTCPRPDRFLEKGVVVELKKVDVDSVGESDIERIATSLRH